jgi:ArsR family transcriptional regulator
MTQAIRDPHRLAAKLKALADETRILMLALLVNHDELCVCDFEHALAVTQSKASRHLRYLLNAGLVDDRREGLWICYRLADDLEPALRAIIASAREALDPQVIARLEERLQRWLAVKTCPVGGSCAPSQ